MLARRADHTILSLGADGTDLLGIVTDLLGMSVFDFLKGNTFAPFPSSHIQNFARQLLTSVACE